MGGVSAPPSTSMENPTEEEISAVLARIKKETSDVLRAHVPVMAAMFEESLRKATVGHKFLGWKTAP